MQKEDAPFKKALIGFLIIDALFVVGAVGLYLGVFQPQLHKLEAQRAAGTRYNLAMSARVHAVEGRLALAYGDSVGARQAVSDVVTTLDALSRLTQKGTMEGQDLADLQTRARRVQDEMKTNPLAARGDLEELDKFLAAFPANQ